MSITSLQEALAPRSDQLNGDDLLAGPRTIRITGARFVTGDRGGKKLIINFEGDNGKPWHPCKTMGRAMVLAWGVIDDPDDDKVAAQFVGKSVTLFRDPTVDFGKEKGIGGIRISHMSHINGPKAMKLTVSQGKKGAFVFEPITADVQPIKPATDAARNWATAYVTKVNECTDLAALVAFTASKQSKLSELETKRADLFTECVHAEQSQRASLSFDEPEGKPDEETGEGFTDAGADAWEA